MRTLLAVAGLTLALGVAPAVEEALSEALRALVNPGSPGACSVAAERSNVPHRGPWVAAGYGECQRHR